MPLSLFCWPCFDLSYFVVNDHSLHLWSEIFSQNASMSIISNERTDVIGKPSALALLFTEQCRDLFEKCIALEIKNEIWIKSFQTWRLRALAMPYRRARIALPPKFKISEFASISQSEFAWDNYQSGSKKDFYRTQALLGSSELVPRTNKLEHIVRLRKVKRCDWDINTITNVSSQRNLEMVKYLRRTRLSNGLPRLPSRP